MSVTQQEFRFDGRTIDEDPDAPRRLTGLMERVWECVKDGSWWTLPELAQAARGSEPSVSARLRDLRKGRFGAHNVERELIGNGIYRYRVNDAREQ